MSFLFQIQPRTLCIVLITAGIILLNGLICNAANTMVFSDNRLTLVADNEPFIPLLEEIAKTTNVVIFISKGLNPGNVSIRFENLPLEKAFNRILKGYNVAMVYHKEQDNTRVTAVKIYPAGKFSGPLNVVVQASIPENEPMAGGNNTRYEKDTTDILSPGEYAQTVEYDSIVVTALEFEKTETDAWKEIQTLKDRINNEMDETKNNVLSIALMDKYEAFETLQKNHINTLENLHRVEHFNASKANKDKQQQQD
jgi:type II secretory pathway component GspD/PulD (secretin)